MVWWVEGWSYKSNFDNSNGMFREREGFFLVGDNFFEFRRHSPVQKHHSSYDPQVSLLHSYTGRRARQDTICNGTVKHGSAFDKLCRAIPFRRGETASFPRMNEPHRWRFD